METFKDAEGVPAKPAAGEVLIAHINQTRRLYGTLLRSPIESHRNEYDARIGAALVHHGNRTGVGKRQELI